jgi:EmrB/QacA subfamily drug resistance transporter
MTSAAQSWQVTRPAGGHGHKWWTLVAMCFGLFIALIDVTIVNVALPTIQRDLHASLSDLQWVVNAYVLSLAVFIVTAGRLGDIFGRRRLFVIGVAVFVLGSLLCGLSGSISLGSLSHSTLLHLARAFQGLGGAIIFPLSLAIISVTFQGKERGAAIGIWGGVGGLATAIGPLVGGFLVDKATWQWIFYINVPIGIIGIFVTLWAVQESRDERATRTIDVFGLVTITISAFCLLLALIQGNDADKGWTSPYILTLFVVAAVALVIFVVGELRLSSPMVDPRLFKNLSFTGAAIAGFALSAGMFSLFFFLALYLQDTLQFSALNAGLRFLPLSVCTFFASPIAGRLVDRLGAKALISTGLTLLTIAVLLMARIAPSDGPNDWTVLLPGMIIGGFGMGIVLPPLSTLAVSTAPRWRAGMASGTNVMCRQVGNAFGIAFLGAILTHQVNSYVPANILSSSFPPGLAGLKARLAAQLSNLGVTGSASAPAGVPHNPVVTGIIQHAVKAGFVDGIVDILHVAAVILAVGALCSFLLIRREDMVGYGAPVTQAAPDKASPVRQEGAALQPTAG